MTGPQNDAGRRPQEIMAVVARRLALSRTVLGFSQAEVCRLLAVKHNTWSMWESGKNLPDPLVMACYCDRFGITLDYIYRGRLDGIADPHVRAALHALAQSRRHPA